MSEQPEPNRDRRRLSATMQQLRKVYEPGEEQKVEERKRTRGERRLSSKVLEAKQFYEGSRDGTREAKPKKDQQESAAVEGKSETQIPLEEGPAQVGQQEDEALAPAENSRAKEAPAENFKAEEAGGDEESKEDQEGKKGGFGAISNDSGTNKETDVNTNIAAAAEDVPDQSPALPENAENNSLPENAEDEDKDNTAKSAEEAEKTLETKKEEKNIETDGNVAQSPALSENTENKDKSAEEAGKTPETKKEEENADGNPEGEGQVASPDRLEDENSQPMKNVDSKYASSQDQEMENTRDKEAQAPAPAHEQKPRKSITAATLASEFKITTVDKIPFGLTASNLLVIRVWGEAQEKGIHVGDTITKVNHIAIKTNKELRELFADSPPPFPVEVKVGTEERITRAREILAKLDKGKPLQQKKEEDEILSRRPSVSAHVAQKDNVVEGKAFKKGIMGRGTRYLKLVNDKIFYAHNYKQLDTVEKLEALEKEFEENLAKKKAEGAKKLKLKNNVVVIPIADINEVKKSPGGSGISFTVGVGEKTSRTYTFEGEKGTTTVFDKWSLAIKSVQRRLGRSAKK